MQSTAEGPMKTQCRFSLPASLEYVKLGAREELSLGFLSILSRWGFYSLFVICFYAVWDTVERSSGYLPLPKHVLVWYISFTEWIIFSQPLCSQTIHQQVRDGSFVCGLLRPMRFETAWVAEAIGRTLVRVAMFSVPALFLPWYLSGVFIGPGFLLRAPLLVALSAVLLAVVDVSIGFSAFWLSSSEPLRWVWHKLLLLLGGIHIPIVIYPDAIRQIADMTPFPFFMCYPALWALDEESFRTSFITSSLLWGIVAFLVVAIVGNRVTAKVEVAGG